MKILEETKMCTYKLQIVVAISLLSGCVTIDNAAQIRSKQINDAITYINDASTKCNNDKVCLDSVMQQAKLIQQQIDDDYRANLVSDLYRAQLNAAAWQGLADTTRANAYMYTNSSIMQHNRATVEMMNRSNVRQFNEQMQFNRGFMQ